MKEKVLLGLKQCLLKLLNINLDCSSLLIKNDLEKQTIQNGEKEELMNIEEKKMWVT